ncbi:hypothetical protein F5J12DRAFT_395083 [Pisolithus orientalis]|uniref:uncharacterized protein n=1 Tax=Pisolithus orientalis TaxID=936130 RepID=UPI0022251350|nr:uncharacterized protein F5J12DRAFT_395083 [Pisolithus orientalis]KAI6028775.1 hypothetical protein F5J12DRAFT_395083 [Pisolithus orientalis]
MAFTASDICKIIFAFILPPLGVFLERGCGADLVRSFGFLCHVRDQIDLITVS